MPGFVNAHFHSYDRFHRGLWEGLPLEMWILCVSPLFQAPLSDRGATVRSQLCAAEMLLAGTTAVVDNMHARSMTVESVGAEIQGYVDVGLRVGVAPMIWNRPFTQTMPYLDAIMPQAEREQLDRTPPPVNAILDFHSRLVKDWDHRDGRVHIMIAPAGPQRFPGAGNGNVRDESASVCLGGAGRQWLEAVPLATDEVRVDVRPSSRSAVFRYGRRLAPGRPRVTRWRSPPGFRATRRENRFCTWGRSDKNRSLPRSDHAGERDCRQEGLYPVYALSSKNKQLHRLVKEHRPRDSYGGMQH